MNEQSKGILYACSTVALFSSFVLVSRYGLSTTLGLPEIAALRFGISALVLSPVLLRHGLSGLRLSQGALLAALGGLGFALFAYAGFALAPAAHGAVLIHGTLSLTTALLIGLTTGDRIPRFQRVALAMIAAGVVAMAGNGIGEPTQAAGDLCLLAASFCWSGYGIYARRLGLPALRAAAIVTTGSAAAFLPVYAVLSAGALLQAPVGDVLIQGLFQGVAIGALSVIVYTRAVTILGATTLSFFTTAVPALVTLGAALLLGERPSTPTLLGVALVTGGMVTALRSSPPITRSAAGSPAPRS